MKIILANPRGFCAGVNMAIECLERCARLFRATALRLSRDRPQQVRRRQVPQERHRVRRVARRGPAGSPLLYSAHGVSPQIREQARQRQLIAIDATCPLVIKVHLEAIRYAREGYTIILIGHEGHDEVIGTMGEAPDQMILVETPEDVEQLVVRDPNKVAYLTQTTLSVDDANVVIAALRKKFPNIANPPKDDICYATQNRQEAVRELASQADLVLVLGSQNSSNSRRLAEIAQGLGIPSHLIDGVSEIEHSWFENVETVLMTAGASAPGASRARVHRLSRTRILARRFKKRPCVRKAFIFRCRSRFGSYCRRTPWWPIRKTSIPSRNPKRPTYPRVGSRRAKRQESPHRRQS